MLTTNRLLNQLKELKRPFHSYGMFFDFIFQDCHVPVLKEKGWKQNDDYHQQETSLFSTRFYTLSMLPHYYHSLFILAHFIRILIKLLKAPITYFFCCNFSLT
ncbi:hypothetical protein HAX54_032844 [Datura stramonium]|uniref:Uncharacterized protein n=1 Tax=Datura stramonium TaxID=4076 RepID=A0ABS8VBH3_DATST|nr:hypothetical protein [Datura stramonium]